MLIKACEMITEYLCTQPYDNHWVEGELRPKHNEFHGFVEQKGTLTKLTLTESWSEH